MNTEEFNTEVTRFSSSLKPFALSLTKDMDDALDLLQETVFRALASRDKFAEGTNLKAWVYTIMKNIFINEYRRKKKHNALLEGNDSTFYASSATSVNDGEDSMEMLAIKKEINKLSPDFRIPFMMHYTGYKYEEIAQYLKLPIGTVKSRIHFARKDLQKRLNKADLFQYV